MTGDPGGAGRAPGERVVGPPTASTALAPRRYLASLWLRVLWPVMAVVFAAQAVWFHKLFDYLFAGWWLLLSAQLWLVPGTVVDAHGFRTWYRLRRRTVPWTDVAEVVDFGPGLAPLRVKVRLSNGQRRTLQHVGGMEVPFLRQLVADSRRAAAPSDRPGSAGR